MNQYYKNQALAKLSGNWGNAVLVSFLAGLIVNAVSGVIEITSSLFQINIRLNDFPNVLIPLDGKTGNSYNSREILSEFSDLFRRLITVPGFSLFIGFAIILLLGISFVSASVDVGHSYFYLNLISGDKSAELSDLFAFFTHIMKNWLVYLVRNLIITIGCCLCIIPGLIASYALAMVPYILADEPDIGVMDAIRKSYNMMKGHKFEYFLLNLSFIGWRLLASCTCGIGVLFLNPYINATLSGYYIDLSGRNAVGGEQEQWQ